MATNVAMEQLSRSLCASGHTHDSNCEECGKAICGCFALCIDCWYEREPRFYDGEVSE